jgi:hypothetical protein
MKRNLYREEYTKCGNKNKRKGMALMENNCLKNEIMQGRNCKVSCCMCRELDLT